MSTQTDNWLAMAPFWLLAGLCVLLAGVMLFVVGAKMLSRRRIQAPRPGSHDIDRAA